MTPINKRSTWPSLAQPRHLALTWVALACGWAQALTITGLEPLSSIGEPFKARITVTDLSEDQAKTLSAKLSPQAAYASAKLTRNAALEGLQAKVRRTAPGTAQIDITGPQAIQSPLLDLIVDINWAGGTLTRQFAVLMPAQTVAPSAPAPAVTTPPTQPRTEATDNNRVAPVVDGALVVVKGDTLSELMLTHRHGVGSMAQRMIATQRNNPEAFIQDNINWVRAGAQLHLPSQQEILAIDAQEAQALVRTQVAAFDAYRQALADKAKLVQNTEQSDQGSIEQSVKGGAQDPKGDRLALSQSTAKADADIADQKAMAAGSAREKELKTTLSDLQDIAKTLADKIPKGDEASTTDKGLAVPTPDALAPAQVDNNAQDPSTPSVAGEPAWITQLKSQPWLLPVVGLLLALLALWVWVRRSNASVTTDAWALNQASDIVQAPDDKLAADLHDLAPTLDPVHTQGPLSALLPDVDLDLPNLDSDPVPEAPAPDGEALLTQAKQALREQNIDRARELATQALAFEDASVQANARALLERL